MKRLFPIIVILITISLLGIIYIQTSWIKNAALIKKEEMRQKLVEATDAIRNQLVHSSGSGLTVLSAHHDEDSSPWQMLANRFNSQIPVSEKFTADEISAVIHQVFEEKGLHTPYEFAVISNIGMFPSYLIRSPHILQTIQDTLNNIQCLIQLSDAPGFLPTGETLVITVPVTQVSIVRSMGWMIAGSVLFTLIIIAAFALTVYALLRQKKISEIKSDLINNISHELKTPLTNINLAMATICNEKVLADPEKIKPIANVILEESRRMEQHIESVLESSALDRHELKLNLQPHDAHELIQKTLNGFALQFQSRNAEVHTYLQATRTTILADENHFIHMLSNLIDNALKYSKEKPFITIQTRNTSKNQIIISVSDKGVGMNRQTQRHIFEKFYRAHSGNVHNVKGFGLGLSYVKSIVDALGWKIKVESAPGKGSRFDILCTLSS
ncbi:two-component system phosphate regulon sensor histidine kinase PhoR [Thermoflavifilum aggregans]|uniref:histidine kinase n=1 Tax=Thermoflavifilum aggregans TaxID=454188 RepID=A0A2M9CT88_9BACT|nr:HAMP domain-containing sensor histidine kinase [Thermoflavifilum aggregans]PJJ75081.1 two-component system phosphate regulon sensor histidine kinase PhoR [Thermoflavifilum aggregans]